jgi:hypothetical protein
MLRGKFQPIAQLKSAFGKAPFNSEAAQCNVAAFAHTVLQNSYSSSASDEQHVKLIIKAKPIDSHIVRLQAKYETMCMEHGVSWTELHEDIALAHGIGWDGVFNDTQQLMCAAFKRNEEHMDAVIAAAGMKLRAAKKPPTNISSVSFKKDTIGRTTIKCMSNCYLPTQMPRHYYFFRDTYNDAEQPIFCYSGVSQGLIPIVIASAVQLGEEMREAALSKVDTPMLSVLLSHAAPGEVARSSKAD